MAWSDLRRRPNPSKEATWCRRQPVCRRGIHTSYRSQWRCWFWRRAATAGRSEIVPNLVSLASDRGDKGLDKFVAKRTMSRREVRRTTKTRSTITKTSTMTPERTPSPPTKLHVLSDEADRALDKAKQWSRSKQKLLSGPSDLRRQQQKDEDDEQRRRALKVKLREEEEEARQRRQELLKQRLLSEESERRREMMERVLQEEQRRLNEDQRESEDYKAKMARIDTQRRNETLVVENLKKECARLLGCLKSPAKALSPARHRVLPVGGETAALAQRIFGREVDSSELEAVRWVQGYDRPRMRRVHVHEETPAAAATSAAGEQEAAEADGGGAPTTTTDLGAMYASHLSTVFPYHPLHNIEVERKTYMNAKGRMLSD